MLPRFEPLFLEKMKEVCAADPDPSHDLLHVKRVVRLARALAEQEGARLEVVIPAAYLHDCVYIAKSDARRSQASRISAVAALEFLRGADYPEEYYADIAHAIEAHSFSANIPARTLEAQVVQDADRLDAIGAIGVARVFGVSGLMRRAFYDETDPFCETRKADDYQNTLDHFYVKLFKVPEMLTTRAGRVEGQRRVEFMREYVQQLGTEIS
jgi:uncharacterized protein